MNEQQVIQAFAQLAENLRVGQAQTNEALTAVVRTVSEQSAALAATIDQNRRFMEQETVTRRREGFIDSKAVGKPQPFSGKELDWPGWSFKFSTWLSGQFPEGEEILDWAASLGEEPVTLEKVEEEMQRHRSAGDLNLQLHAVLVSLTTMGTAAFDLVKNTKTSLGLDAWRRLVRKFDPNNPVANLRLLRKILRPSQVGHDQLLSAIEQWEQDYQHYRDRTGETLSYEMMRALPAEHVSC